MTFTDELEERLERINNNVEVLKEIIEGLEGTDINALLEEVRKGIEKDENQENEQEEIIDGKSTTKFKEE